MVGHRSGVGSDSLLPHLSVKVCIWKWRRVSTVLSALYLGGGGAGWYSSSGSGYQQLRPNNPTSTTASLTVKTTSRRRMDSSATAPDHAFPTSPSDLPLPMTPHAPYPLSWTLTQLRSPVLTKYPLMTKSPLHRSLIVPVNCSCSGDFYQYNASYTVNASDTYFSIANNICQGLTNCQALKAQNPSHNSRGHLSEDIDLLIPLRCACPVDVLISSGYNYLLSYIINMGENISSIAQTFHVEKWAIYAANDLPYSDEQIFSSTALLIPLKDPPTAFQTRRTSNCVPNDALLYEIF